MKFIEFCKGNRLSFYVALLLMTFMACEDPAELGIELLPTSDLFSVGVSTDKSIEAYNYKEDSVRTDETAKSLFGSIVDPVFGKTNIDLAAQYSMPYYRNFGEDAVADSMFLFLFYRKFSGDTLNPLKISVYELDNPIHDTLNYYQDEDLSLYASSEKLAEYEFTPKTELDSTETDILFQTLQIRLDNSLAERLISYDSTEVSKRDLFLDLFKGLYVKMEEVDEKGAILELDMLAQSGFVGSAILMHYHNSEEDTTYAYRMTEFNARINSYTHDYSTTTFADNLNKEETLDSLIYIQSTGGLRSKIYIPSIDNWEDSTEIAINKAELVFHVDTVESALSSFPIPNELLLTIVDNDDVELLPLDYSFSPSFYGGVFDTEDHTYRFNITQHMQEVIDGQLDNNELYLSTAKKNQAATGVVLKGSTSASGIELIVTYSKINQ